MEDECTYLLIPFIREERDWNKKVKVYEIIYLLLYQSSLHYKETIKARTKESVSSSPSLHYGRNLSHREDFRTKHNEIEQKKGVCRSSKIDRKNTKKFELKISLITRNILKNLWIG